MDFGRTIPSWPAAERPREKLLRHGAESLSDAEVLAIILVSGHGVSGHTALDLARHLLSTLGSLNKLAEAGIGVLTQFEGIGPTKAIKLKASFELARRTNTALPVPGTGYGSSSDIFHEYHPQLRNLRHEVFIAVLLDIRNRPIKALTIAKGSLTEAIVHPREVFLPAIQESAASLIFVHNHPSGDPTPSQADLELTRRLCATATVIGMHVLDHLVIGAETYFSFLDQGLISVHQ